MMGEERSWGNAGLEAGRPPEVDADTAGRTPVSREPWQTVVAMLLSLTVGLGAMSQYAFGLFIGPIVQDTGWGNRAVSGGVALFLMMSAVGVAVLGALIDRFGPRWPALASVLLCVLSITGASLASSGFQFAAMLGLAGAFYGAGTGIAFSQVISARFNKRRGLALGIGTAGTGVGGIILPQYSTLLLEYFDWRGSFLALAITVTVIAVPAVFLGLPPGRGVAAAGVVKTRMNPDKARLSKAVLSRHFVLLAFAVMLASCSSLAMMVHAIGMMTAAGFPLHQAATVMSAVALASIIGRMSGGYLMDILFAPVVSAFIFALAATCAVGTMLAPNAVAAATCLVVFGFVAGAEGDVIPYMISRYFDQAIFGRCFGIIIFLFMIAGGTGVLISSWLYERSGEYTASLIFVALLSATAALLISQMGPYRNGQPSAARRDGIGCPETKMLS